MELFLFLALVYSFTFVIGILIEKIRIPWIFAALFLGLGLALYNPFSSITSSSLFVFLARLGMLFLLFVIGFELDVRKMMKKGKFFVKATFFIIPFEAFFGSLIVHFVFGYPWVVSILVALSFATVGEAALIPILDEFKIVNKPLGQAIIGIGVLDDIIEVVTIVLASILIGSMAGKSMNFSNIGIVCLALSAILLLTYLLSKLKKRGKKLKVPGIEALFLFIMAIFCLFIGIGVYAELTPVGAILAGMAIKNFVPEKRLKLIESEVKTAAYGIFAPLFFLWVGLDVSISYLITYPLLVLLVVAVSNSAKLLGSYIIGKDVLGKKQSALLGLGLMVRFSTSIVITKLLFESGLIGVGLYSVLVASTTIPKFIVPVSFSLLVQRWRKEI